MKYPTLLSVRSSLLALTLGGLAACEKQEPAAPAPPPLPTGPVAAGPPPATSAENMAAPAVTPLDRFKEDINAIKAFMVANEGSADAKVGFENLKELISRASAVKTEGIPEDLAASFQRMISVMKRIETTLADLPVPLDQFSNYFEGEKLKGGAAADEVQAKLQAFQTSMEALAKEGEAASAELKEVGARYGIQSLDLGSK